LEDELGLAEVHDADLSVGRLPLVVIAEPAAEAEHGLGVSRAGTRGTRDQPAGDIHLVNALVADVAVAEVPEPVPVVMDQVLVIRLAGGRTEPEVEIDWGRRRRAGLETDTATGLVA